MSFFLSASVAVAQTPMTLEQYTSFISDVNSRFLSVFHREIIDAAVLAGLSRNVVSQLELQQAPNCVQPPSYALESKPPTILSGQDLLVYGQFQQQAILFFLMDLPGFEDPDAIDVYTQKVLWPAIAVAQVRCEQNDAELPVHLPLPSPVALGTPPQNYTAFLTTASQKPLAELIANYVSAFPAFFSVLHEMGHYVLDHGAHSNYRDREIAADAQAIAVFHASRTAAVFGISQLELFGGPNSLQSTVFACRVLAIARADEEFSTNERMGMEALLSEWPRPYQDRAELLRRHYLEKYEGRCSLSE